MEGLEPNGDLSNLFDKKPAKSSGVKINVETEHTCPIRGTKLTVVDNAAMSSWREEEDSSRDEDIEDGANLGVCVILELSESKFSAYV